MILMKGSAVANAALELNIVLQNELNMTRWDPKIPGSAEVKQSLLNIQWTKQYIQYF
jgi:hypothetical protein